MRIPSEIFLVDLDDTLIDSSKIKSFIENNFGSNHIWKIYNEVKKEFDFVDYDQIISRLAQNLNLSESEVRKKIFQIPFDKCLHESAVELVRYLQTFAKVYIFSSGHFDFQYTKIKSSGLEKVIGKENIFIFQDKEKEIANFIKNIKAQDYTKISMIDNSLNILESAFKIDKQIKYYWVRQGNSLQDIYQYIYDNNTIIKIKTIDGQEFILKLGLTQNQSRQLITYSLQDKLVAEFTSDLERFKNIQSFYTWLEKGKCIYSLVDTRDNLYGIVWFSAKDMHKYKITVALRLYDKARGKGLAVKFLKTAIKYFNYSFGIWSIVNKENVASIKTHLAVGFRPVTKQDNQGKIVLVYE